MKRNKSFIISYMQLRIFIGLLGMLLPFICVSGALFFADKRIYPSISMYYFSNMRDVFVGILISVSFILMTYKGYEIIDSVLTKITGIAGICIALFPCENIVYLKSASVFMMSNKKTNIIHLISAFLFFLLLALNSIFRFTKSETKVLRGTKKYYRNILYQISGYIIIISLIILVYAILFTSNSLQNNSKIILILEIIMCFSFGISWLVKGGALFKEEKKS